MIERKKKRTAKVGVFAVAHATYWGQFEGLKQNIMGYHADFCSMVKQNEVEVIDFGMIDSSEKAYAAVPEILAANVDILFCNMVTYATSSVFAETAALCNAGGIPAAAFSYEITAIPTPFYEYLHIAAVRVIGLFYPYRFGMAALLALCGTLFLLLKIRKRKGKMDQP